MREVETDYLVVGAGASGMAFVDTLVAHTDAEVGWSTGVTGRAATGSTPIGLCASTALRVLASSRGRSGTTASTSRGERRLLPARGAPEICDYYARVLDEHLLPTGRVRFVGMSEYHGNDGDGHLVVSLLDSSDSL